MVSALPEQALRPYQEASMKISTDSRFVARHTIDDASSYSRKYAFRDQIGLIDNRAHTAYSGWTETTVYDRSLQIVNFSPIFTVSCCSRRLPDSDYISPAVGNEEQLVLRRE